jgi:hypothetical protein
MRGVHTKHVALAGAPEGDFDLADAIDAVTRDPAEGHVRGDGPLNHRTSELRLRPERCSSRDVRRGHAGRRTAYARARSQRLRGRTGVWHRHKNEEAGLRAGPPMDHLLG